MNTAWVYLHCRLSRPSPRCCHPRSRRHRSPLCRRRRRPRTTKACSKICRSRICHHLSFRSRRTWSRCKYNNRPHRCHLNPRRCHRLSRPSPRCCHPRSRRHRTSPLRRRRRRPRTTKACSKICRSRICHHLSFCQRSRCRPCHWCSLRRRHRPLSEGACALIWHRSRCSRSRRKWSRCKYNNRPHRCHLNLCRCHHPCSRRPRSKRPHKKGSDFSRGVRGQK